MIWRMLEMPMETADRMLAGVSQSPASYALFAWDSINGGSGLGVTFATHCGEHFLASSRITWNSGKTGFKRVALRAGGHSSRSSRHGFRFSV